MKVRLLCVSQEGCQRAEGGSPVYAGRVHGVQSHVQHLCSLGQLTPTCQGPISAMYHIYSQHHIFINGLVGNVIINYRGYDLWQRARLQFAEFDQQRGVHDVDVWGGGQLEQFSKDHLSRGKCHFKTFIPWSLLLSYHLSKVSCLHNVIVERNLVFSRVAQQLCSTNTERKRWEVLKYCVTSRSSRLKSHTHQVFLSFQWVFMI